MHVSLGQPYDFTLSTERFRTFGSDGANAWHAGPDGAGGLHRFVGGREVRIEAAPGGVEAVGASAADLPELRHLLGAAFDLDAFAAWAAGDETLAPVVAALEGFRPMLVPDPWEALVTSITAQQVSLRSATAIRSRLIEAYGAPGEHAHAFPARDRIAGAGPEDLVALGFSGRKAEYVVELARSELDVAGLASLADHEVKERLVALRGLGEWTADWFLARHLGRPHAWPAGDLALVKAVRAAYAEIQDVRAFGERLHPFQNLAAQYLLAGHRLLPPA